MLFHLNITDLMNNHCGIIMAAYVKKAFFVYETDSKYLCRRLLNNPFGVEISCVGIDQLEACLKTENEDIDHVVVAGSVSFIKRVFALAKIGNFGIGLVPLPEQKNLLSCFDLSRNLTTSIDLALQSGVGQFLDLIFCNDKMLLFKATMGRIPLFDATGYSKRFQLLWKAAKQLVKIRLMPFQFTPATGKTVDSCACGCMIIQHYRGTMADSLIGHDSSSIDGKVSLLISAPFSVFAYFKFILGTLGYARREKKLPGTIGYIKSSKITIDSGIKLDVHIDGKRETRTPLHCRVEEKVVRVNLGVNACEKSQASELVKEKVEVGNLPRGKEVHKLQQKQLPLFSVASEDRFKALFVVLRGDARIDDAYITLMLLSTLLATIGLYLNSVAVVIGAMILAPLMAPIVSLAMGLLRRNDELTINSLKKIGLGIFLALAASAFLALLFSHKPITSEMRGRINPSLLDLGIAVLAGIAAAYTKSFKEIMQALAGVAIAVALVPPLAVAGIGLGRGDLHFFNQAFLLFLTNLVGIVFAALFTFRVLGFSPVVKARRSVIFVLLLLALITVPLYISSIRIAKRYHSEKSWQVERFLVNGKYIIIQNTKLSRERKHQVLSLDILAREALSRVDLNLLKDKIKRNFSDNLVIRAKIIYIL